MNTSKLLLVFTLSLFTQTIFGQVDRQKGWMLDEGPIDTSLIYKPSGGKGTLQSKVDLTAYCPTPGNQGSSNSCSGWATSYSAMTILRAIVGTYRGTAAVNKMAHSANFIYNHLFHNAGTARGVSITRMLQEMKEYGVCLENTFPNGIPYQQKPSRVAYAEAEKYKINDFKILFDPALGIDDFKAFFSGNTMNEYKIFITKTFLNDSFPVMIAMNTPVEFVHLKLNKGEVWNPNLDNNNVLDTKGHAVTVVGYDDKDQSFTLMNSYGKDWGQRGFIKISYTGFAQLAVQACIFTIKGKGFKGEDDLNQYSSSFHIRVPHSDDKSPNTIAKSNFPKVVLDTESNVYSFSDYTALNDHVFQLVCDSRLGNLQFNLFNIDQRTNRALHIGLDNQTVFPGEQSYFQVVDNAFEYLILTISNFELNNSKHLAEDLNNTKGEVGDKLKATFGPWLLPKDQVTYDASTLRVAIKSIEGKHFVVPIILKIEPQ